MVCRNGKKFLLRPLASFIIGDHINHLNIREVKKEQIFLGEKVYQPFFAECHHPNKIQWKFLRKSFVSQDGFPLFNSDWSYREPKLIPTYNTSNEEFGKKWVAILGKRYGKRQLVQSEEVEKTMIKYFGKERVKVFDGNVSLFEAKELFNRALVFITPHGALLTNMLFMPPNGFVLEIKPHFYRSGTFIRLNKICHHNYYHLEGRGTKRSTLRINMESFFATFEAIIRNMKLIHPQKILI